jgi:hypothetical protein
MQIFLLSPLKILTSARTLNLYKWLLDSEWTTEKCSKHTAVWSTRSYVTQVSASQLCAPS